MPIVTPTLLDGYLGKSIDEICTNGFTKSSDNHCAHFVAHVLDFQFGVTCKLMGTGKNTGANIRVQEVFPRCGSVGEWAVRPIVLIHCLVFITRASNVDVKKKTMVNVPRKHIGIYHSGSIWHYSNTQDKVVKQLPADFSNHYASPDNAMFFGTAP